MEVPWSNPSLECTQAHHTHGRIIIGYNIATTIIEGIEVQLFNYEMKVIMEPVKILTADGAQSGKLRYHVHLMLALQSTKNSNPSTSMKTKCSIGKL